METPEASVLMAHIHHIDQSLALTEDLPEGEDVTVLFHPERVARWRTWGKNSNDIMYAYEVRYNLHSWRRHFVDRLSVITEEDVHDNA